MTSRETSRTTAREATRDTTEEATTVIDTVVYDLGNVLVHWDPRLPYEGHLTPEEVDRLFDEIDFFALNHRQDLGEPWPVLLEEVARTHPHRVEDLRRYVDGYALALPGPVEGSQELARELKDLGLRLVGLTNWSAETFHLADAIPAVQLLDDVLVSGRVGLAKPDPRIFRLLVESYGVDPARAVFTDDMEANVVAGRAAGFHAQLFTSTAGLRHDLAALGVPVRTTAQPQDRS
ncbi:HAD family hydrolase [Antribacter gilvus]|uniref:HAD family hydrolase n=1 Tax=Antribacter gilvus TaxID=2304675 RepID=UPI001F0BDF58|nr:HAD family phosphatase [Antribacter gilvus]